MRYVWGRKLEGARRDLLSHGSGALRISEVAFRWGFNDLSHFSRSFKQSFGCSPRDFRERRREERIAADEAPR